MHLLEAVIYDRQHRVAVLTTNAFRPQLTIDAFDRSAVNRPLVVFINMSVGGLLDGDSTSRYPRAREYFGSEQQSPFCGCSGLS
jgi:hypothetical protein